MTTTLPLYWDLSSAVTRERIDSSVKLIRALQEFQAQFVPQLESSSEDESQSEEPAEDTAAQSLKKINSEDVCYAIRRLIRGLASPRESSRLGFAVALTELLSTLNTVTTSEILSLLLSTSQTKGSMNGQEVRDMCFARLFGLTSLVESGLLCRDATLPPPSTTPISTLEDFHSVVSELIALGEKKVWLRESCWWSISLALTALHGSDINWKQEAQQRLIEKIFVESKEWGTEKLAIALRFQSLSPEQNWRELLAPTFKDANILGTGSLNTVARILRDAGTDEEDGEVQLAPSTGSWKPQLHFAWDVIFNQYFPGTSDAPHVAPNSSFQEFFRIVVDESLFSSASSAERKSWGFLVFLKALSTVPPSSPELPMLFTKNFMRTWINHLSGEDRYLHKISRKVATEIQSLATEYPTVGVTLVLQLLGTHGNLQFDKITKTRTVESILKTMNEEGVRAYIDYLTKQFYEKADHDGVDAQSVNAKRTWVVDQLSVLVRNGAITKADDWMHSVLELLVVHGYFSITKKSEKSPFQSLRAAPRPPVSDDLHASCRTRLFACLGELTSQITLQKSADGRTLKLQGSATDGEFWVAKVLDVITGLEKDRKHVALLAEIDEDVVGLRQQAMELVKRLEEVPEAKREIAKGAELLLLALVLLSYNEDADSNNLEEATSAVARMFPAEEKEKGKKKKKKAQPPADPDVDMEEAPEPIDLLMDILIGFMEKSTSFLKAVAAHVFALVTPEVKKSTIELILTQLEKRDVMAEDESEGGDEDHDHDMEEAEGAHGEDAASESSDSDINDQEDSEEDGEVDPELRERVAEALQASGMIDGDAQSVDSDGASEVSVTLDDDQMMQLDEQLAAIFKASQTSIKKDQKVIGAQREATYFKIRVLDFLDIFVKKQPSSELIAHIVFPLIEIVRGAGTDEEQLSTKAIGLLNSRITKLKEMPPTVDVEYVKEVLEHLHNLARKAPTAPFLSTISQCSLYLSRIFLHHDQEALVLEQYRASLDDFITRKSSRLNTKFFQDFVSRVPATAWNLRDRLLELCEAGKATNIYRQCQVFDIIKVMLSQAHQLADRKDEFIAFVSGFRRVTYDSLSSACDEDGLALTAAQTKELLKIALHAVRQTKRLVPDAEDLSKIWDGESLASLSSKLSASERFKSLGGVQNLCRQLVALVSPTTGKKGAEKMKKGKSASDPPTTSTSKRKEPAEESADAPKSKGKRRKKADDQPV
ncbi:hypothetical protein BOTBODRAFT_121098 [Botryobasidium botryosum FD-172 SS1]|uniref:DNA polymerase V n=1 Tax=Botryobasidium botryosum (strain FD-172 SS1) TaxID=930990 RepID=A0A067M584_BOTB1|nr:hypothetical protein BOTBODRAFT_121098 [Botryobasidium botryosum FD-172 SS1]